jgi:hypothetical protein
VHRTALLSWLAVVTVAVACGVACGEDEVAATAPPDTTADAGEDTSTEPIDASTSETSSPDGCKTAAAPSAECTADAAACERKTLYISNTSTFPFAMVTDDANVYWVAQSGTGDAPYDGTASASILRISKTGQSTQQATVLAEDQPRATTLIKDGSDLYWIVSTANDAGSTSTLRKLAGATGAPQDIATFSGIARRLVRVASGVFFTVDGSGNVRRLTKDGMVSDIGKTSTTPSLAANKDFVFASGGQLARVDRIPVAGGSGSFLALPDGGPDAALPGVHVLGADCDRMFGIRDDEGAFFWSPAVSATYTATTATFEDGQDIVSDDGFVYVAQRRAGGGVFRGSRDGKGFASLYTGDVWRLAVDDDGIYWGEHAKGSLAGNVFMQTKK